MNLILARGPSLTPLHLPDLCLAGSHRVIARVLGTNRKEMTEGNRQLPSSVRSHSNSFQSKNQVLYVVGCGVMFEGAFLRVLFVWFYRDSKRNTLHLGGTLKQTHPDTTSRPHWFIFGHSPNGSRTKKTGPFGRLKGKKPFLTDLTPQNDQKGPPSM